MGTFFETQCSEVRLSFVNNIDVTLYMAPTSSCKGPLRSFLDDDDDDDDDDDKIPLSAKNRGFRSDSVIVRTFYDAAHLLCGARLWQKEQSGALLSCRSCTYPVMAQHLTVGPLSIMRKLLTFTASSDPFSAGYSCCMHDVIAE